MARSRCGRKPDPLANANGVYEQTTKVHLIIPKKTGCTAVIELAQGSDGLWRFGYHIQTKGRRGSATGVGAGSSGKLPWVKDPGFPTKEAAVEAASRYIAGSFAHNGHAEAAAAVFPPDRLSRDPEPAIAEAAPAPAPPRRRPNAEVRGREHLTPDEVERLAKAAEHLGRHGYRDALMIRVAFRHGLRAAELVGLRRDQVDLDAAQLHVRRVKHGLPSTHPLAGWEVRALRKLFRDYYGGPQVFLSERKTCLTENGFHKIVARAGEEAKLPLSVHPHMLRHACGFKLANDGQDTRAIQHYLGHRNIQHTVRYTELASNRFKSFWKD